MLNKRIWVGAVAGIAATILCQSFAPASIAAAAAVPNDPFYGKQSYLNQTRIPDAWEWIEGKTLQPVTVAVVDTGVDLEHPDLKERLVQGKNILNPSKPPQDDYGHGTNVAGLIAAVADNGKGIAGIAPNVRIMPVKAIDSDGHGDEEKLGEGVRYAVDHGAKIIVLSLGLNLYSTFLSEIVDYAEQKGVLLVAATGNEGKPVKYPAAYGTVVAVGGASVAKTYKTMSNFGPEIDLIAPWYVYTTANGGGYAHKEGTSMAAPQVAAVAALMLGLNPNLTPQDIRERLRQTADPVGGGGWNSYSGYGLLRAHLAVSRAPVPDMFEPNDAAAQAKPLSVEASITGSMQGITDVDWFYMDAPYAGEVALRLVARDGTAIPAEVAKYASATADSKPEKVYNVSSGSDIRIPVAKGRNYIAVRPSTGALKSAKDVILYKLETQFQIYRDPFEDNDRAYKAFVLPERSQQLTGTFHQVSDQDWFALQVGTPGSLRLKLTTDTPRIDPELYVASEAAGMTKTIDDGGEGEAEFSPAIDVTPGRYYVRVRNVKSLYPLPVAGEYKLDITFEKKFVDGNEPNNKAYQATTVAFGTNYKGVFDSANDEDWFKFQLSGRSLVTIELEDIPKDRIMKYTLFNSSVRPLLEEKPPFGATALRMTHDLGAGSYYIGLKTDAAFQDRQYVLRVRQEPLIAGFRDIAAHWGRKSIETLVNRGVLKGYGDYRFLPNKNVTRAEAAAMIVRAFQLPKADAKTVFSDVAANRWYADAVSRVAAKSIVRGYPDRTFRPDQPITRAEMAAMIAAASGMREARGKSVFSDVPAEHWAAGYIQEFADQDFLRGFSDGSFRPAAQATRAEIASLLDRITDDK
jgi:hypothetical protein